MDYGLLVRYSNRSLKGWVPTEFCAHGGRVNEWNANAVVISHLHRPSSRFSWKYTHDLTGASREEVPGGIPPRRRCFNVNASQIANIHLHSESGLPTVRLRRLLPLRSVNAGELAGVLVKQRVFGLAVVSEAHDLGLGAGNGADVEGV